MPRNATLIIGTNKAHVKKFLNHEFNRLTFASDNMETVAHYWEGGVIEFIVELDDSVKTKYIRSMKEFVDGYQWGEVEMRCPEGATWYAFSCEYLKSHLIDAHEIFPDLTVFADDEDI